MRVSGRGYLRANGAGKRAGSPRLACVWIEVKETTRRVTSPGFH